jgi:hypothetical protein
MRKKKLREICERVGCRFNYLLTRDKSGFYEWREDGWWMKRMSIGVAESAEQHTMKCRFCPFKLEHMMAEQ